MLMASVATAGNQTASQRPQPEKGKVMVDSRPPATGTRRNMFLDQMDAH